MIEFIQKIHQRTGTSVTNKTLSLNLVLNRFALPIYLFRSTDSTYHRSPITVPSPITGPSPALHHPGLAPSSSLVSTFLVKHSNLFFIEVSVVNSDVIDITFE